MKAKGNILKLLIWSFVVAMFIVVKPINVEASEDTIKVNTLLQLTEDVDVMESADTDAKIIGELSQGKSVIITEEPVNGWIGIKYQDIEGYIQLENISTVSDTDNSALAAEFDEISNDNRITFEQLEHVNTLYLQKLLWGIVIVLIVIALFAVGIISSVRKNKNK